AGANGHAWRERSDASTRVLAPQGDAIVLTGLWHAHIRESRARRGSLPRPGAPSQRRAGGHGGEEGEDRGEGRRGGTQPPLSTLWRRDARRPVRRLRAARLLLGVREELRLQRADALTEGSDGWHGRGRPRRQPAAAPRARGSTPL